MTSNPRTAGVRRFIGRRSGLGEVTLLPPRTWGEGGPVPFDLNRSEWDVRAEEMTSIHEPPLDAVYRLRDAMNSHDARAVAACFTPDYRCERPIRPSLAFVGSDRVLSNWTGLLAHLPDLRAQVLRASVDGEEVWTEWIQTGTEPDGTTVDFRGVVIMTMREGLIDWTRFYLEQVVE